MKRGLLMDIAQTFYDNMASEYDKLFLDWQAATQEHAEILNRIFVENGFDKNARILDCACGIGTQAIGLAGLGYHVTASDISDGELEEARERAGRNHVEIRFEHADFCALSDTFREQFDIVIAMDNALPHMLTEDALEAAVRSIVGQIKPGGIFVASIRDYDSLLKEKPSYSPPYIHKADKGQRVSFQTWVWNDDNYQLTQYIIDDEDDLRISRFQCEYRAVRREELTNLLLSGGCSEVVWKFPEETGFYQPVVVARKRPAHHEKEKDVSPETQEGSYWIVDILPKQVPADSPGQYFAIEKYFLQESNIVDLRRKYLHLLLKLNCYYDLSVSFDEGDHWTENPAPGEPEKWFLREESAGSIRISVQGENTVAVLNADDTYMTVYHPADGFLELLRPLAAAEGLFLWKPESV